MSKTETQNRIPLASTQWLKYLGIVLAVLCIYVVANFYYKFGDDVFPKSLTIGQHIKLSLNSIGSMLSELFFPLLFFSGALLYRSIKLVGINPLVALKRDLLIILPLGILLWVYGAFGQEPAGRGFYVMIFEIQQLEPGEKLVQNPAESDLFALPDLYEFYDKVNTLDIQIEDAKSRLKAYSQLGMEQYINELQNQQSRYKDEIMVIHFTPLYIVLFFLFGLLLGYLIPLHKVALIAILMAIGFTWYYVMSVLESLFGFGYSNMFWYLLGKIGLLLLLNTILLIVAIKVHVRTKDVYL